VYVVLHRSAPGLVSATQLSESGSTVAEAEIPAEDVCSFVADREREHPRWVWDSTANWYPQMLARGIRVARCVDLALSHAILRMSALTATSELARTDDGRWDDFEPSAVSVDDAALFSLEADADADTRLAIDPVAELRLQRAAVAGAAETGRIRLLLAAESAGALIAAEMRFAGLPWRSEVHDRLLTELLGPRVPHGVRPLKMAVLTDRIRAALDAPSLNPDSQADLLRALRTTGLIVTSTRAWELRELEHPAIAPLLEYKKLSRLLTANGWSWMDAWIVDGRFHPDYVPGAVVTGRWATRGGGALQLPKQIRGAVVADPGWKLVVADAAQLEPRILAALSADSAMAAAGRGHDLYDGIVASGAVDTRAHAKVAMLGAMYGATTGDSARLVPRLARAYPRAIALVEDAARTGERGDVVTTWLGRSSPRPGARWLETQARAYDPDASTSDERAARGQARDWGRFTRNFVVQGSAAEWALCWMAELRKSLAAYRGAAGAAASRAPEVFAREPHLVFFLHDEVIVHAPEGAADEVALMIREAAATAGRLLFGSFPVDFALSVAIVDRYSDAK
jgi:DNA polymerase-1